MGYMPSHDPGADPSYACIVAKVVAVSDETRPARVTIDVIEVVKPATAIGWVLAPGQTSTGPSAIPPRVELAFHPTRSEGQEAFYIVRAALPDQEERLAALARRPVNVPMLGSTIRIWITETAPGVWTVSPDDDRWRPEPPRSAWSRLMRLIGRR